MYLSAGVAIRNILDKLQDSFKRDLVFTNNTFDSFKRDLVFTDNTFGNLNMKNRSRKTFTDMCKRDI